MAKKIALLLSLVMMFSLSCVFAADLAAAPDTTTEVISGEVSSEVVTDVSGEELASGEVSTEVSGDVDADTEVSGNVESGDVTLEDDHDHDTETESNGNNTVVGAIIAIVIVVAVVAIVSVLQKK